MPVPHLVFAIDLLDKHGERVVRAWDATLGVRIEALFEDVVVAEVRIVMARAIRFGADVRRLPGFVGARFELHEDERHLAGRVTIAQWFDVAAQMDADHETSRVSRACGRYCTCGLSQLDCAKVPSVRSSACRQVSPSG